MKIDPDAQTLQPCLEKIRAVLAAVLGDDYTAYIQACVDEFLPETEHIRVISDAQVPADFIFLNVPGADDDDDLRLVCKLFEEAQFAVGLETGQNPGGMIVVKKLSAEFQIKFSSEFVNPLTDVGGLHVKVFVVVKSNFHL